MFAGWWWPLCLLCLNYLQIELRKEAGTRSVPGLCFRGAKTNTVLHSQAPALHPLARVQAPWTNSGQGADNRRTDLNGQGRGCAPRSAGHTVPMNDPEAESKNAPQGKKEPNWLKWLRWFGILVGGLAITSFLIVVGVVLWVFWIIKDIYDRWP